jgi:peptidoglycan/LPS O-acetylase OafA/YrhL
MIRASSIRAGPLSLGKEPDSKSAPRSASRDAIFSQTRGKSVYNGAANLHDNLDDTPSKPSRRWSVIAAGLLILAIGLVVMFTGNVAFRSPTSAVVLAAVGLVAVLLQLRLRPEGAKKVHAPQWLNLVGIGCAALALFADYLKLSSNLYQVSALGAVGCFGVSGVIILDGIRRSRASAK